MSVLSSLRTCVVSGNLPRVEGDVVRLSPDIALPRKTATAWRYRKGGYLDLESIAFFLDNERLVLSQYVKACSEADVQIVPFAERKPLTEFLRGNKDSHSYHQIDQDREQQQQHRKRNVSRRASESASIRSDIAALQLLSRPPSSGLRASRLSTAVPVRIPRWAWWWLLLSSIVMAVNAAYLILRPLTLPHGRLHQYFASYESHTHHTHATAHTADPFTPTVAILLTTLILVNITTLVLYSAVPTSAWSALLAVTASTTTLCVTAFNLLYQAMAVAADTGGVQQWIRRLMDMGTWDVGYVVEYVGTSVLWLGFPLAIIVIVGGQFVRAAAAAGAGRADKIAKV